MSRGAPGPWEGCFLELQVADVVDGEVERDLFIDVDDSAGSFELVEHQRAGEDAAVLEVDGALIRGAGSEQEVVDALGIRCSSSLRAAGHERCGSEPAAARPGWP